jgi:cobalamin biosynthesis protein CbiG
MTEAEYQRAIKDLETGRADLAAYKAKLVAEGLPPDAIDRLLAASAASHHRLERQIAKYLASRPTTTPEPTP